MTEDKVQKDSEIKNVDQSAMVKDEQKVVTENNTGDDATTKKVASVKKKKGKKGIIRQVNSGRAYVKSTYNNTIVTFTDQNGNVLTWSSAGQCGFKGPKKSTPYAATMIVKDVCEKVKKHGLREVAVFVRGIGGGREAAVRAINANGLAVTGIQDVTPIPHNGCRAKKTRRV